MLMSRRFTLAASCVTLALAAFGSGLSQAAAPQVKTPAPGYYRMMLGSFEVTALSDGAVALPMDKLLQGTTPAAVQKIMAAHYVAVPVPTSVNAFLINTGAKLVLIDTGAGQLFGPTLGRLPQALKAAGYSPEQVDEVYITHEHGDHVGGLAPNGVMAFPNAIVRIEQKDLDALLASPKGQGPRAMLEPYLAVNHVKAFSGDTEMLPGIRARVTGGHTPGHSSYIVESGGQKLVVTGDLIHDGDVQFAQPRLSIQFDSDGKTAVAQRLAAFDEAAAQGEWLAAAHIDFPGIGHVRKQGTGYEWIPVGPTIAP